MFRVVFFFLEIFPKFVRRGPNRVEKMQGRAPRRHISFARTVSNGRRNHFWPTPPDRYYPGASKRPLRTRQRFSKLRCRRPFRRRRYISLRTRASRFAILVGRPPRNRYRKRRLDRSCVAVARFVVRPNAKNNPPARDAAYSYRALYNYKPQNNDELELREGDVVFVMEKCDDGWYVGSSKRTGGFGTFPGNYVQRSV